MHFLETCNLTTEHITAKPVYDNFNRMLIGSDVKLTSSFIKRLNAIGINGIYVTDDFPNVEIDTDFVDENKNEIIKTLCNFNIDKAYEDAKKIASAAINEKFGDFISVKTFDGYTYEHSLSVSILSAMVGLASGFKQTEIENLTAAGLLHDIGKRSIDSDILNKPGKLTSEEYTIVKGHSQAGFNMLKDSTTIPAVVKTSILEHHENEDGSGYPRGIKSKDIYKFAKIIHITDVYDALTSKRPYKEPYAPSTALTYLDKHVNEMFDKKYLTIFKTIVPAYPRGLLVDLSDGRKAVVIKNNKGNVLRPVVQILKDKTEIDLSKEDDLLYIV